MSTARRNYRSLYTVLNTLYSRSCMCNNNLNDSLCCGTGFRQGDICIHSDPDLD